MNSLVDTLIDARWVIPVSTDTTLEHASVAVHAGRIVAVDSTSALHARFQSRKHVVLSEHHVLIPGLVNAHTHAAMSLMRGYADDLPLMRWLQEKIWPTEATHMSHAFVRDGTLAACAEMLRGGVTCMNDMYFFPEAAAEAVLASGMRAMLGMVVIEFPTAYASGPDEYLEKGLALRDALRHESRVGFCLAPHAPYTVSDASFARIAALAEELGLPVHIHLHETADEVSEALAKTGERPLARLARLGLLGPQLIAVHAVHLDEDDIALLARHGASVAHCPASNLKLASGFCPVAKLQAAGVNVALGTDGAASNNRLDMFAEMRLAALLAKAVAGNASALSARAALRVATIGGARAMGMSAEIGSIEPGKAADLVAVNLGAQELQPIYDPVSHLVYACGREQVSDVWVNGSHVVEKQQLNTVTRADLDSSLRLWQNLLQGTGGGT